MDTDVKYILDYIACKTFLFTAEFISQPRLRCLRDTFPYSSFLACTTGCARGQTQRTISAEWSVLSHIDRFIQGKVLWFQVLLFSLEPCYTKTSRWYPPVFRRQAVKILLASALSDIREM